MSGEDKRQRHNPLLASKKNRQPKVANISGKFTALCCHCGTDIYLFQEKLRESYQVPERTILSWINKDVGPRNNNLTKLTDYWTRVLPEFREAMWSLDLKRFIAVIKQLRVRPDTVDLSLPYTPMTEADIRGWVGTYRCYRHSFQGHGRVVQETLIVTNGKSNSQKFADVVLYAARLQTGEPNIYAGVLYRFGSAYYAIVYAQVTKSDQSSAAAQEGDVARTRMICLPFGGYYGVRNRWGIVSGCSGVSRLPVAARIILKKTLDSLDPLSVPDVGTQADFKLSDGDMAMISNDISSHPHPPRAQSL